MTAITIHDYDGVLLVVAKQGRSLANGLVTALASGGFCVIAFRGFLTAYLLAAAALLAAGLTFLLAVRQRTAKLRVTNAEMRSKGRIGDRFLFTREVKCEDVRWLEHQTDTTGPETSHHPEGLYAVLKHKSVCILPYVDEQQAGTVIERIREKFPNLRQSWEGQSPFGEHFTSLGISKHSD